MNIILDKNKNKIKKKINKKDSVCQSSGKFEGSGNT